MGSGGNATAVWLALVVGNTRLHWAVFQGDTLQQVWHTRHLTVADRCLLIDQNFAPVAWATLIDDPHMMSAIAALNTFLHADCAAPVELYLASVVPAQTQLWQAYPQHREITLEQVPLEHCYATLGIDRALNLLGAGDRYGWPALVIDGGTALTFTAGDATGLIGGAILPGLRLQFETLGTHAANLPTVWATPELPARWACTTSGSIQSGVLYGAIAIVQDFVTHWRQLYPDGRIVLTGGDGHWLHRWLQQQVPGIPWQYDPDLTFGGLAHCRRLDKTPPPN